MSKRKPKAIEPDEQAPARSRRLNLRLTEVEYDMLTELRLALHQSSDAATVRTLLRLHHTHARRAVNDLHRRVERSDDLQDALEARQLRLFRRGES